MLEHYVSFLRLPELDVLNFPQLHPAHIQFIAITTTSNSQPPYHICKVVQQ